VTPSIVDVFVANLDELAAYSLARYKPYNIILGVPGIHKQREFIQNYYDSDQKLICIDDDVENIKMVYSESIIQYIDRMFSIMEFENVKLAGLNPTDDGRCLEDSYKIGLYYVIGAFFLMINVKGDIYPHATTEDFTRTAISYYREGAVIRFSGFGIKTKYFIEDGGLQSYRTAEIQKHEMEYLVNEYYPELLYLRQKPGKMVDAVFKRQASKKILNPFQAA